ncbi:MAG: hypothetical protein A2Y12_09975 [Planctomycetes bacterium GWF2_42_9]|nr:MAG: hypothetical protein A2Y12_09975 [Planctomycetes bacterium GWF2_42_9]
MLISAKYLTNYKIESKDGNIGQVHSFLFDDKKWIIRYLVVDTGGITGRKVLIVPSALGKPDGESRMFPIDLTKDEIEKSPTIDADKPVSRAQEAELHKYYNWAAYWSGPFGLAATPVGPVSGGIEKTTVTVEEKPDTNLRSTREVIGYALQAADGVIGHVDDFIIHQEDWVVRYMIVDINRWLIGRKVIIPPDWISEISWENAEVFVDVSKETVRKSPDFNPSAPVNREYEIRLYDYYGRPKYWSA